MQYRFFPHLLMKHTSFIPFFPLWSANQITEGKNLCWRCFCEGDNTDSGQFLDFEIKEEFSHIWSHISYILDILCLKWEKRGRVVLMLHIQKIICFKNEVGSKGMNFHSGLLQGPRCPWAQSLLVHSITIISKNRWINHES